MSHFDHSRHWANVCFPPIADIGEYCENRGVHRPEHEADKDETRWEERLKKVAKAKPEKPE